MLSISMNLVIFGHTQLSQQRDLFTILAAPHHLLLV